MADPLEFPVTPGGVTVAAKAEGGEAALADIVGRPASKIMARIVTASAPFADLAFLPFESLPRNGDLIRIHFTNSPVNYRVIFTNFEPNGKFPITLGCAPFDVTTPMDASGQDIKQRMDDVIKWQLQVIERGQTFSNAMIVAGYAGIFGLWTFSKSFLSAIGTDVVAIFVGISLFVYISWELYSMIIRANAAHRFVGLLRKQPAEFFTLLAENDKIDQSITAKIAQRWKAVVWVAGILAYGGGLLLLWNAVANLFHLPQWP